MEFKFRAVDDRTPPYRSSPSLNYFSEQMFRVNYTMDPNFMHNSRDFYTIWRQIEKERIRREIIMEENVHRRLLEEEVRKELMMEREMAKSSKRGLSIDERLSMHLPTSFRLMHPYHNRWFEDRIAFPGNCGLGYGHYALSLTRPNFSNAVKDDFRSALEVNKKDKLIMLPKPGPNLCGGKQKATTPPAGSRALCLMSSKKLKEWSCALCQVSATSEGGLNEHLRGKKHKAKEAGLIRAQRMCYLSTSSTSKKSGKQIKLTESRECADRQMKIKVEEESVEAYETEVGLDLKMEEVDDSENKNEELTMKDLNAKTQKKKNGKPDLNLCGVKRKATTPTPGSGELPLVSSKKPKEWSCALCQVSATSERGLNNHLRGKKHKSKEAGIIRAQRMLDHSTSSMSKKSGKQIKLTKCGESADEHMKIKVEGEANKTGVGLDLKMEHVEGSENKNEELPMKDLNAKSQKKKKVVLKAEKRKRKVPDRKNFKFWCEDCQVGTHSAVLMESHKRGKKHMARHYEYKPNGAVVPATTSMTIMALSEPTVKAEDEKLLPRGR